MRKIIFTIMSILIFVILPLIGNIEHIVTFEIIYLICAIVILNFTQPSLKKEETGRNRSADKNTVFFIIVATGLSISIPIIDWAYFSEQNLLLWQISGVILNISGLILRYYSIRVLGRHFTATVQIKSNHNLIQNGPYKIIRHPSYTGAYIALLAFSFVLNSIIGIVACTVLMGTAYFFRIKVEEKKLIDHFGKDYKEYQQRSYKMIPFIL